MWPYCGHTRHRRPSGAACAVATSGSHRAPRARAWSAVGRSPDGGRPLARRPASPEGTRGREA
jgi:hypothetical protein